MQNSRELSEQLKKNLLGWVLKRKVSKNGKK